MLKSVSKSISYLIVACLFLSGITLITNIHSDNAQAESSPYLRWKPPVLEDPIVLTPTNPDSFFPGYLNDGQDYIINLNSESDGVKEKRTRAVQIRGGGDIVIIGGHTTLGYQASETAAISITRGDNTSTTNRIVHIEGVQIDGGVLNSDGETPIYHDGIVVSDPYVDLRVQNTRVTGLRGKVDDIHSDIIQAQSTGEPGQRGAAAIRIDKLTGTTNYQGMYLVPDDESGAGPAMIDMHRVNLSYSGPPEVGSVSYMVYFGDIEEPGVLDYAPGHIDEFYIENNRAGQVVERESVWPSIQGPAGFEAVRNGDKITWPGMPLLHGAVTVGQPAGGDFVPEGVPGIDYVSPGYQADHMSEGGIQIAELTPSDNNVSVNPATNSLEITFENFHDHINKGTGTITLFTSDGTEVEQINVASANVSKVNSSTMRIALEGTLQPGTSYYVHIDPTAFYDGTMPDPTYFAGITDASTWNFKTSGNHPSDSDGDGIPNSVEDDAPNGGDGNNDGTPDSEQLEVASFKSSVSDGFITLVMNCSIATASSVSADSLAADGSYRYPLGLVDFTADCGAPGSTASITQYYYNPPEEEVVFRKFADGSYRSIEDATIERQTINSQPVITVSYSVTDGGELDDDGVADGVIVDPAGIAVLPADSPETPNTGLEQLNNPYVTLAGGTVLLLASVAGTILIRRKHHGHIS